MINPVFRLPIPPVDIALTPLDQTVGHWIMLITSAIAVIAALFALKDWRNTGRPVLLLILVGGALANTVEPFVDIVGGCYHPVIGQTRFFELMGRSMPMWLFPTYIAYFGVQTMVTYMAFRTQISKRAMWLWFSLPVISDVLLEECLLSLSDNLYVYYGNQPLTLHLFPMWWAPVNTLGIFMSAVALALLVPYLKGWKTLLIPLFTPLFFAASAGLPGLPVAIVVNTELPTWIVELGGISVFLLAFAVVHVCTFLVADDSPGNLRRSLRNA